MGHFFRYEDLGHSSHNADILVKVVQSPVLKRLVLGASISTDQNPSYSSHLKDGSGTNLPLVRAVAEFEIPALGIITIVFDGNFMTAVRSPRDGEVKHVLKEALKTDKVCFADKRVEFTGGREPNEAARVLLSCNLVKLTEKTVTQYWSLLSNMPWV